MTPETSAKFIQITAIGFIGFAILWATAPYAGIDVFAQTMLDILDWPYGDKGPLTRSEMWLSSIGAGLTMAISVMLLGIVVPAINSGDQRIVRVTIWAFVAWYIVDGVGSYASGVGSNVFFNTIFLLMILLPLMLVRFDNKPARK